jgi:hypothetical protein
MFPVYEQRDYAKAYGDMWIDSAVNVGAYWRARVILCAFFYYVGSTATWQWTLPATSARQIPAG